MIVHDIDLARWYMGSEINSVYAIGGIYLEKGFEQHNDVDNACALTRFENNGMAFFYCTRVATHGYHIEMDIMGTKGMLRVGSEPVRNLCTIFDERGIVKRPPYYFQDRFADAYRLEMQEFIHCIREGKPSPVTVYDGLKDTEVAYAMTQSMRENTLVVPG
jgi:myo-inositol 2-dehydrogenase/D-chiro-inositol 1-dehydrogenase